MASNIQDKIDHVVVLMLENRSFDNLLGWLYDKGDAPKHFIPATSPNTYKGLDGANYWNPTDLNKPTDKIYATAGVENFYVPTPDPNEDFKYMNRQQFGLDIDQNSSGWLPPEGATPGMQGFLADFATAKDNSLENAKQIMQAYTKEDLSVLSGIARHYAVSDNYHASSPTQTWPNRAFMHAGTSLGRVNNFPYLPYDCTTIYNVLEEENISWKVYKSSEIIPSLTRIQMFRLWDLLLFEHFRHISDFLEDCHTGNLPAYSFLEPSFVIEDGNNATSEHPPADVCAGDHFLQKIWQAIVDSPAFDRTLFIINFDEHGGCPDHVPPNWTATPPDEESNPGDEGFRFNRFGVRVPAIFASPYIAEGTLFRANEDPCSKTSVPYDHTSILAMILDWKGIDRAKLPSKRVDIAPKYPFDQLLNSPKRSDLPTFTASCKQSTGRNIDPEITSLQKSIIVADAHYRAAEANDFKKGIFAVQKDIDFLLDKVKTNNDIARHFSELYG